MDLSIAPDGLARVMFDAILYDVGAMWCVLCVAIYLYLRRANTDSVR